jgi:hypothetical protein
MLRARVPTENWTGPQGPARTGPGRTYRSGMGCARGLDARAGSRHPPAVMVDYLGALLAHGQDNRYGTGADRLGVLWSSPPGGSEPAPANGTAPVPAAVTVVRRPPAVVPTL